MRFMTIYKPGRETTSPPSQEHIDAMTKLIGDMAKSGTLITTDGLQHSSKGARVSINADGSFKVVDGPLTEAKEIIGGYAIINVNSKAERVRRQPCHRCRLENRVSATHCRSRPHHW